MLIHALPIYHTHGLFVASNVTLFARASMIFLPKFDPELIIKLMARATVLMGVPTFYTRLLQSPALTKESTKHMRLFISGSAPLLADTHREWSARTGHAVLERYGMTETNMNTSNPYDGERVPGAVGHPLPGVSVRVTDPETGKELARDEIGMIEVKGPNVFKGYWRMPEKTKAEFRDDGFFITGDLGKIDAKGYVHILGRGKDLVISGGFNVYPKEIESEIDAMPGVIESAVIGVPHADFGEGVTAVVVCNKGADVERSLGAEGARRPARQIQDAEAGVRRRRIAAQRDGQGAEEYFARYVQGYLREANDGSARAIRPCTQADHKPAADDEEIPAITRSPASRFDIACATLTPSGAVRRLVGITSTRADQRDVTERKRQLQRRDVGIMRRRRPAGIDIAERAGNRDQHRQRG